MLSTNPLVNFVYELIFNDIQSIKNFKHVVEPLRLVILSFHTSHLQTFALRIFSAPYRFSSVTLR